MTSILKLFTASASTLALTSAAFGLQWTDRDPNSGNGPLDFLNEPYGSNDSNYDYSYSSDFNIAIDGFDPSMHVITGISVWFAFADDASDDGEWVDIWVGDQRLWDNQEVDGNHNNAPFSYHWLSMDVTGNASIYNDLQADGIVDYYVGIQELLSDSRQDREDTYLKIVKLKAEGYKRQVPEAGATLSLLGLGLLGLAAARKRFGK